MVGDYRYRRNCTKGSQHEEGREPLAYSIPCLVKCEQIEVWKLKPKLTNPKAQTNHWTDEGVN